MMTASTTTRAVQRIGVADSESVLRLDLDGNHPAVTVEVVPEACEAVDGQLRWLLDPSSLGHDTVGSVRAALRGLSCSAW